jgi:hypothetical protein
MTKEEIYFKVTGRNEKIICTIEPEPSIKKNVTFDNPKFDEQLNVTLF